MIPIAIARKIFLFFAPLVIFYILRKIGKKPQGKSHQSNIDKSRIVEGEIVEPRDTHQSFSEGG